MDEFVTKPNYNKLKTKGHWHSTMGSSDFLQIPYTVRVCTEYFPNLLKNVFLKSTQFYWVPPPHNSVLRLNSIDNIKHDHSIKWWMSSLINSMDIVLWSLLYYSAHSQLCLCLYDSTSWSHCVRLRSNNFSHQVRKLNCTNWMMYADIGFLFTSSVLECWWQKG